MKSYRTLAFKELLAQKMTSFLILAAIILSTAMTTVIGQSAGVLSAMRQQQAIALGGDRYATFVQMNEEQVEALQNDPRLSYTGVSVSLGTVELSRALHLDLIEFRDGSGEIFPSFTRLREGRLPERAMEIALPEDALRLMGVEGKVGDTITLASRPASAPLPGYRKVNPMVFCGIFPADGAQYQDLREALERLQLNDASLTFEPETSAALGFGFRCGFLGLLHMEIIQERLEREYDLDLITTAPSVIYRLTLTDGTVQYIDNPTNYPDPGTIQKAEEPFTDAHILAPNEYVGNIMELCQERRGVFKDMKYLDPTRVDIHYELPLNEIVYDFFDALKSRTKGYASFDYEFKGYVQSELVKLDILLNGDVVDALSFIVYADNAYARGRKLCERLQQNIPRQLFEVPIQAAIGGKIIARETVRALRKDVLAKCYGGDITRKKKLLEKQKEGKKRMRRLGSVEVPQEAFMAVLKLGDD